MGGAILLRAPEVQAELKLTEDQKTKHQAKQQEHLGLQFAHQFGLASRRFDLYGLVADGKALAADFSLDTLPKAGLGYAAVSFPAGGDAKAIEREMHAILTKVAKKGVPAELVEAAKRKLLPSVLPIERAALVRPLLRDRPAVPPRSTPGSSAAPTSRCCASASSTRATACAMSLLLASAASTRRSS